MVYLGKCYQGEEREQWFTKASQECPEKREAWVELAQYYYENQMWEKCLAVVKVALNIEVKPLEYLNDPKAWSELPYDLAAIAAHNLGHKEEALTYGEKALMLNPTDERLKKNLEFYKEP